MIGIIDYGMGNLRSVQKAFQHVGAEAMVLATPQTKAELTHLVLPGVGAFADAMDSLVTQGWIDFIHMFLAKGRPFLGICLGMQLLFDSSEEDAISPDKPIKGLGLLAGQVKKFTGEAYGSGKLKVPHMGWNTLQLVRDKTLFADLPSEPSVYFVHSYYCQPTDVKTIAATTCYGHDFCCSVEYHNIWATQFHPEKSQRIGLKMLTNFAKQQ